MDETYVLEYNEVHDRTGRYPYHITTKSTSDGMAPINDVLGWKVIFTGSHQECLDELNKKLVEA